MVISWFFNLLFFAVPLFFWPRTSEVFEFNKVLLVYGFTVLIVAVWLGKMISQKKIIFHRTTLDIPILLFLATQALSTIISIDSHTSFFGYYSRFHGGLLSLISYALLYWAFVSNMDKQKTLTAMYYALSTGVIVSIYGIFEHFGYSVSCLFITGRFDVACWVQDVQHRIFATLGQPNWLAAYLVALTPLTWAFAAKKKSGYWIMASVLFYTTILFTKSRSGLLGLGVAFAIYWLFNLWKNKKHFIILTASYLFLTAIVGTSFTQAPTAQGPALETGGTESGDIRKIVWKGALDVWRANPILGTGVETFAYSYYQFRPAEHNLTSEWDFVYNKAHNEYLNFLANTGLVGTTAYLTLIGASLFVLRKNIALLAGYVSILITNFFGFSVVPVALLFFLYPAWALTLQTPNPKHQTLNKFKLSNYQKGLIAFVLLVTGYLLLITIRYWQADFAYNQKTFASLTRAIKLRPAEAVFYDRLARIKTDLALASEDTSLAQEALADMQKAVDLSPRNVNIRRSQAGAYIMLAKLDPNYLLEAIKTLTNRQVLAPTDVKTLYHLGLTYARIGDVPRALELLDKALDLKPNYQDAQLAKEELEKL